MIEEKERLLDWEKVKKIHPAPHSTSKDKDVLFCKMHGPTVLETDKGTLLLNSFIDLMKVVDGKNIVVSDPNDFILELIPDKNYLKSFGKLKCGDYTFMVTSSDWTGFSVRRGNTWGSILRIMDDISVPEVEKTVGGLFEAFKDSGIPINRLLSPAKMSERVIRETTPTLWLPDFAKGDVDALVVDRAYQCFRGGRMEAASLGTFPGVCDYDMVRAYYSILRELPSIKPGYFKWIDSNDYIPEATFGFCLCEIDVPDDSEIGPIGVRLELPFRPPRTFYPTGENISWRTKSEIDMLRQYGLAKVKILRGSWAVTAREAPKVFAKASRIIEKLMKDDRSKDFAKFMSSMSWGKLASIDSPLWNPIYASFITSEVRCIITKLAIESGDDLIAVAVDGLASRYPLKNIEITNEIGGLRCDIVDQMVSLADFYRYNPVERKPGWYLASDGIVIKFRNKTGDKGEFTIPFGSTKRKNPKNLNLEMLMNGQFKLPPPTSEDAVEIFLSDKDPFPGRVNWW